METVVTSQITCYSGVFESTNGGTDFTQLNYLAHALALLLVFCIT